MSQTTNFINELSLNYLNMRKIQLFKLKSLIYVTSFILLINSFLWYQLSLGFFDKQTIWFLFLIFNQLYMSIGGLFIYSFAKDKSLEDEIEELKYIISRIKRK